MKMRTWTERETTWAEIKQAEAEGREKELLKSGDEIYTEFVDGEELVLVAAYDKRGKLYFVSRDCLKDEHRMNDDWTNEGGWAKSEMRRYLNKDVYARLPEDLKAAIVPTKIIRRWNGAVTETYDKLFLLSRGQVFGADDEYPDDTQLDIFRTEKDRVKLLGGTDETWPWWLRSAYGSGSFRMVYASGNGDINGADSSLGVALGFCLNP